METDKKTGRNVYGTDLIVTYCPGRDLVLVQEVNAQQGSGGRFTSDALLSTLGYTEEDNVQQFVKNNNLHQSGNGLRGALLLVNRCIGLVVRSKGSFILFEPLLPSRDQGTHRILDLRKNNRHYGFFLQQIHGPRLAKLQASHNATKEADYPYSKQGCVYMNPAGPDFYVPVSTVSEEMTTKFQRLQDNLCSRNYTAPSSRIKNLRKSNTTLVVYVADSPARLSMGDQANCFYVPVGQPVGQVDCPWKSKDGTHAL
jgi:hypothetical protein